MKTQKTKLQRIGQCEFGPIIHASDPCYSRSVRCAAWNINIRPGIYNCYVVISDEGMWGKRVAEIEIFHVDTDTRTGYNTVLTEYDIGVDSGQAGFFCDSIYPKSETGEFGDKETFYGVACDATLETEHSAGIIFNKGFLSSSGFGDGGYDLYLHKENGTGQVIGAKIVFIGDEGEEEDYED